MIRKKDGFFKRFDYILFISVVLLSIYGLIIIHSASYREVFKYSGYDLEGFENAMSLFLKNPLIKQQLAAFFLGIFAIGFLVFIDYDLLGKSYLIIYAFCNLLLIAVLLFGFGEERWGARSWLAIGGFTFQPAELVKIGAIISISKYIEKSQEKINELFTLIKVLVFSFVPILLIAKQPDFGTASVFIFFIGVMLYTAGLDYKYIAYSLMAALISMPVLWFSLKPYQKNRIIDFINGLRFENINFNATGSEYQVVQSILAVGSGKLFGQGLFNGNQTQTLRVPENQTDFVFSVVSEEFGFIGGLVLLLLFFIVIIRLIKISRNSKDTFGSLMVIGISSMIIFHVFENIGMTMGMLPMTGIPLPFISYGGTFLLVNLISIGLVLSIGMKKEGLKF